MTAKQYLIEINKYHRICLSLQDQIEDLRHQIGGLRAITYDKDRVQVSPSNKMEELVPKLIKLEERYTRNLIKYKAEVLKRTKQIAELPNPLHVTVLTLRYCQNKRWEEIAAETGYTFRHITRVHGDALQAFARKYKMS